MKTSLRLSAVCLIFLAPTGLRAQPAPEKDAAELQARLDALNVKIAGLVAAEEKIERDGATRSRRSQIADVEVFAKAVEWILRHEEFYKPNYVGQARKALDVGGRRADLFARKAVDWAQKPGRYVVGYYSEVDGSVQPYALTLPPGFDPGGSNRWPLHLVLHGRAGQMNEVNFIDRHEGKPVPKGTDWIQLDVFGRTNNAYRWSGETDVFEALRDVRRRFRIDDRRITLRGFSMGGAGAWHLGLHHPSEWSSVGPGAGFVDTYKYQKIKEKLPEYQDRALGIYDAVDYVMNAADVPVCTYGGELDSQLVASTSMVDAAKKLGIEIKLLIGPGVGHKFTPEKEKEFMAFHIQKSKQGRPPFPGMKHIRFTTRTLRYNHCDWLTIESMIRQYAPVVVEAKVNDDGSQVTVTTENVATISLSRDIAVRAVIDGDRLPLSLAADNLLPKVYFTRGRDGWNVVNYDNTRRYQDNPDALKRHGLQGPIDDAFMTSFICVRGTGTPWSQAHHDWAMWTLDRFGREFDKWLRGKIRIVDDVDVTQEMIGENNLILFGDPGSNSLIARCLDKLPIQWTESQLKANGSAWDPNTHGVSLIYPNPLNPKKYVVLNSGHTFHEPQFKASNAQLYPRLGDFAVQQFKKTGNRYEETTVTAAIFNGGWFFPAKDK